MEKFRLDLPQDLGVSQTFTTFSPSTLDIERQTTILDIDKFQTLHPQP